MDDKSALPEPFRQVQLFQFLLDRARVLLSIGSDANALDAGGHAGAVGGRHLEQQRARAALPIFLDGFA